MNDLDAEEVGKVVTALQEEITIIKLQLENLPGYDKGKYQFAIYCQLQFEFRLLYLISFILTSRVIIYICFIILGEVPEHLSNLKIELERTFANLERKNEMLINAMSKNFGKTH